MSTESQKYSKALFGGGCFWCMQQPFELLEGVVEVTVGYTGGEEKDPGYEQVASGRTSHYEAVQVVYDPERISYWRLVGVFWRQIDPTDNGGQFADRGNHYRTAIFYADDAQKWIAERSFQRLVDSGKFQRPLATRILPAGPFYPAEEYHQGYYLKSSAHYLSYKTGSGRAGFLQQVWGGEEPVAYVLPEEGELRRTLSPLQYEVARNGGTEPPFNNEYWDNKRAGIYVDVVSGEPLFSSTDKYDSGTGWPSFKRPIVPECVVYREDTFLYAARLEVRSARADSHLGHVFDDGPEPTGKRYCINSAALRFVAADELATQGYADFLYLFDNPSGA